MPQNDKKSTNKLLIAMKKADKKLNHYQANSGRFNFPRFTKLQNYLLESLYVMSDLNNPSAYRLYLYLIRNITGYENKEDIQYYSKKMKADLNMGNSFYKAIEILKNKNLIDYVYDKYDRKYIELNVYPNLWETRDKDKIDEIVENEINKLLGKEPNDLESLSSSSTSSSSSSSKSFVLNDDDALLAELDDM